MGGHSRICYHGVPRIIEKSIPEDLFQVTEKNSDEEKAVLSYVRENRININVRQVFPNVHSGKNET